MILFLDDITKIYIIGFFEQLDILGEAIDFIPEICLINGLFFMVLINVMSSFEEVLFEIAIEKINLEFLEGADEQIVGVVSLFTKYS